MSDRCRRVSLCDLPSGHDGPHRASLTDGPAVREMRERHESRTVQEHADAALRELDAICRDSLEIALPVLLNARDTAGEETPADHFIALSDEIDALLALLAEAQQERDEAQSAAIRGARLLRDFGARLREAERKIESETARAEARLKRARVAERLAEQRGEALRNLIAWADGKVGDDFGTTEWESARAALADGGQQEKTAEEQA